MTGNQASPARPGLPGPQTATGRPQDLAGHRATSRRPAGLPPAAATAKKTARYAPLLAGGAAAAVLAMAAAPAMASTAAGRDTASAVSIAKILGPGDIVTGVRGTTDGNVIVTGSHAIGQGDDALPFLYQGPLTSAAEGDPVSVLQPPFPGGIKTATFYGPDTNSFNPDTIPAGQIRAVGSYQTMTTPPGGNPFAINHGMIYLGPLHGSGGSWTSIDVPANGSDTVGGVRACPQNSRGCFVMDTIAHSTMGDLVVGNYDLNLGHGVSGNAFIYNMSTQRWTLLQLGGSLASQTTLYGIWQNGGPGSPDYTLAGGSSAHGSSPRGIQRAFLMNYNERTGIFGKPRFYSYGNRPVLFTHFDGITAVPGGFNLATISFNLAANRPAPAASMAFVPVTGRPRPFGQATWYPVPVGTSSLCSGPTGCGMVTANTVFQNQVMGLYTPSDSAPGTYLATVAATFGSVTPRIHN
jgi:hypothetical protein